MFHPHWFVSDLTHFDSGGRAHMVDVGEKAETHRIARARGRIRMLPSTLERIRAGTSRKGDVLGVARIAAIQGSKRTSELIPLCHPLRLTGIDVDATVVADGVELTASVRTHDRTGVEMEALTAVAVAGLTVIDMVKAIDPAAVITDVRVLTKAGGASGDWARP